jgi:hypothetical protein
MECKCSVAITVTEKYPNLYFVAFGIWVCNQHDILVIQLILFCKIQDRQAIQFKSYQAVLNFHSYPVVFEQILTHFLQSSSLAVMSFKFANFVCDHQTLCMTAILAQIWLWSLWMKIVFWAQQLWRTVFACNNVAATNFFQWVIVINLLMIMIMTHIMCLSNNSTDSSFLTFQMDMRSKILIAVNCFLFHQLVQVWQ